MTLLIIIIVTKCLVSPEHTSTRGLTPPFQEHAKSGGRGLGSAVPLEQGELDCECSPGCSWYLWRKVRVYLDFICS